MRVILTTLFLILSFQSLSKAENIKEFEIEGLSIGDSALEYYSESEINSYKKTYYKNNKYFEITLNAENSNYDSISLTFNTKDNKYKLHQVFGTILFDKTSECKSKKDKVIKEISNLFSEAEKVDAGERSYSADPSGKSKTYSVYYWLDEAFIEISCYILTKEFAQETGWMEKSLAIGVVSKEFANFLSNEQWSQ